MVNVKGRDINLHYIHEIGREELIDQKIIKEKDDYNLSYSVELIKTHYHTNIINSQTY